MVLSERTFLTQQCKEAIGDDTVSTAGAVMVMGARPGKEIPGGGLEEGRTVSGHRRVEAGLRTWAHCLVGPWCISPVHSKDLHLAEGVWPAVGARDAHRHQKLTEHPHFLGSLGAHIPVW